MLHHVQLGPKIRKIDSIGDRMIHALGESLFLLLATIAVPMIVYVDSVILGDGVSEYSITEITQETLLFCSASVFFVAAGRYPRSRGFLTLVGGFFTCMLIRELDFLFDMVRHGFWLYPALVTAAACMAFAAMHGKTILAPMASYFGSKSWVYVTIGLLIVLAFSRLFGSGQLIWNSVMGGDYKTEYKAIIQEGLELYGYLFIFYGSWLLPERR